MTKFTKILAASALAISLTACATYDDDNSMMKDDSMMQNKTAMKNDMKNPMVGGAPMMANMTIVENASAAPNLSTLVAAVKQAQLVETLSGPGPFTVFAPTNAAFDALPDGTVSTLLMDDNRADLQKVLTAHVIPGTITSSDLMAKLGGGSSFSAETVSGDTLTFYKIGDNIRVADENNTLANIEVADVMQSNGVVHVVSSVLVPQ